MIVLSAADHDCARDGQAIITEIEVVESKEEYESAAGQVHRKPAGFASPGKCRFLSRGKNRRLSDGLTNPLLTFADLVRSTIDANIEHASAEPQAM
jgi:hypothetical protein